SAIGTLPDLGRLTVSNAPQSVARPQGRQVKQRRATKSGRQGPDVWHCKRFYVAFIGDAIKNRNSPKSRDGIADGAHQLTAVRAGLHGRILLQTDARAQRIPAFHIKRPQPRSRTVPVTRYVEHCPVAGRGGISDVRITLREAFWIPAGRVNAP